MDAKSFPKMFELFSENIIYIRGEQTISGMKAFRDFYIHQRKLSGQHTIKKILVFDKQVIVKGVFDGKNSNENTQIIQRETYLANGFKLIK
ncbi:MAG: nuclear transport factor 2 family protein [Candidatus Woesearchaeota archaeon]